MGQEIINFMEFVQKVRSSYEHDIEEHDAHAQGIVIQQFNTLSAADKVSVIVHGAGNKELEVLELKRIEENDRLNTLNTQRNIELKNWGARLILKSSAIVVTILAIYEYIFKDASVVTVAFGWLEWISKIFKTLFL